MKINFEHKTHFNDRFIPTRSHDIFTEKLEVLDELIASQNKEKEDILKDENGVPISQQNESNELQQGYQSLLQNQVLGIKDTFTMHQLRGTSHIYTSYPYTQRFSLLQSHDELNPLQQYQSQYQDKENEGIHLPSCCGFLEEGKLLTPLRADRKISSVPFKVLDAPALQDDFYLNVVDWSSQGLLAVGLGSCVYLWTPQGKVTKLNDVGQTDSITSVSWSKNGNFLSIGAYSGNV